MNEPDIPDDHPIREIWEKGRQMTTLAGEIELAKSGDAGAANNLLKLLSYRQLNPDDLGRQRIQQKELLDYLAECFNAIQAGTPPSVALHLTTGKKGRPELSFMEKERHCLIGWKVAHCMNTENLSLEDAIEKIGPQEHEIGRAHV